MIIDPTQLTVSIAAMLSGFFGGGSFVAYLNYLKDKRQDSAKTKDDIIDELHKIIESERVRFSEQMEDERKRCSAELSIMQQRLSFVESQLATMLNTKGVVT